VVFRLWHEFKRRSGLMRWVFPLDPPVQHFITLKDWKVAAAPFFFSSKADVKCTAQPDPLVQEVVERIRGGEFPFFNNNWLRAPGWRIHPLTGYQYPVEEHWSEVPDLSTERGDIKYVWGKARFSYLLTLIRDDYHNGQDHGEWVFKDIDSWIADNPINAGPNWRCSQEISLRTFNWIFALYYYRDHPALNEERFQRILPTIFWQIRHVYDNIHFSRIAVRNNHAISECLLLFLGGLLFPFLPKAKHYQQQGKQWLEQELCYQIYEDGSYLQHSMNYHRVVVQLLCWGIVLGEKNGDPLSAVVYDRARKSLHFLEACTATVSGHLPNYGNNDGALFFPLSSTGFRDYRPSLSALALALKEPLRFQEAGSMEEAHWYGLSSGAIATVRLPEAQALPVGGYYTWREKESFTFIRCGDYKDRPGQADALHLDLWYQGENILRDAGTYSYNDDEKLLRQFWGTAAHNTLTLGDYDQMQKGSRFIWYYWTTVSQATTKTTDAYWEFSGTIKGFQQLATDIYHQRTVRKYKDVPHWEIRDQVRGNFSENLIQHWHLAPEQLKNVQISATDEEGKSLALHTRPAWYSSVYGHKEESSCLSFVTPGRTLITTIKIS
ncbi:MAG: alginate lyase family protein, partial [Bacteroidota bacterium]